MNGSNHLVTLEARERLEIKGGVVHVHSFDSDRIIVETSLGFLDLVGQSLHIEELNLEQGYLAASGMFTGVIYSEGKGIKGKGKGVLKRILK